MSTLDGYVVQAAAAHTPWGGLCRQDAAQGRNSPREATHRPERPGEVDVQDVGILDTLERQSDASAELSPAVCVRFGLQHSADLHDC